MMREISLLASSYSPPVLGLSCNSTTGQPYTAMSLTKNSFISMCHVLSHAQLFATPCLYPPDSTVHRIR